MYEKKAQAIAFLSSAGYDDKKYNAKVVTQTEQSISYENARPEVFCTIVLIVR